MTSRISVLFLSPDPRSGDDVCGALAHDSESLAVDHVEDVDEAADLAEAGEADYLLLDRESIRGDGVEVVERVRSVAPDVPLALVVDDGTEGPPTAALDAGATDFVRSSTVTGATGVLATRIENAVGRDRAASGAGEDVDPADYETVIEGLGESVFVTDRHARHVHVNPAGAAITGYDVDELLGSPSEMLWSDEQYEEITETVVALSEDDERELATFEADMQTSDGETVPVELVLTARYGPDGEYAGTVGVAKDISERRATERELREYESILRALPDEIAVMDTDGVFERIVPPTGSDLTTTNYAPSELEGEYVSTVMSDEAVEACIDLIVELRDTDAQRGTLEFPIITKEGEQLIRETHIALLRDEDDEIEGSVAVMRDIRERKARERELERFETLIELMPDTVVLTDLEGTVTEIHGSVGWSGYDEGELVDEHMGFALTPESVERAEGVVADIVQSDDREKATFELEIEMADGTRVPYENHITLLPPDEDGEVPGTMSVLRNVSERVERERKLQRQNERLEQFASIASHDLRNPLNLARGHLELLEADGEHAETIERALERMGTLIDDTLTWARQGSTVEEREPIALGDMAPACWEAVGTDAASLTVEDATVEGDPGRVRQVVENLFRNAIEHGGEEVAVRLGRLEDADGFYVEDDGPGIPPEKRTSVFEAGHTTSVEGTGFGLAIVAEICEAHGWEIAVVESDAGGARFEITGVDVPA